MTVRGFTFELTMKVGVNGHTALEAEIALMKLVERLKKEYPVYGEKARLVET